MNKCIKAIIILALATLISILGTSCQKEQYPFMENDEKGYTVSIKFDANGGTFATSTSVIIDTYNPSHFPTGSLPLLTPDDTSRESPFTAKNSGYFLAGWYASREAVLDSAGNHLDHFGNIAKESGKAPAYKYSDRWDFENDRFAIDVNKAYTSSEPALVLYAAWVPEFSYEFYDIETGELIGTKGASPLTNNSIKLPAWNVNGTMSNNDFPSVLGKTFGSAYLDEEGVNQITSEAIAHSGSFNPEDTSYSGNVMKIYVKLLDGTWYKISTVEQFIKNANPTAHYIIEADLDFSGKSWPLSGNFSGSIHGQGHTFSNITARQSSQSANAGLFSTIQKTAVIEDLNIENASYSVLRGSRNNGATFGLFAGTVYEGATVRNVTLTGKLYVSAAAQIPSIYNFGLVCGLGYDYTGIDFSGITVEALAEESTLYEAVISVDGNDVTVVIKRRGADS